MEFTDFNKIMQKHLKDLYNNASSLYQVEVDKDDLWNTYLDSFPAGTNGMFRQRREYDCSCCRQFIRAFGNVGIIKDNKFVSIWDFKVPKNSIFFPVISALSTKVHSANISGVFLSPVSIVGTAINLEHTDKGILTWEHFCTTLPDKFVKSSKDIGATCGAFLAKHDVLLGSFAKISMESLDTILELVAQNTLYKGMEWQGALTEFKKMLNVSEKLTDVEQDLYCWDLAVTTSGAITNIKNHSIGTLLLNVTEGVELDEAVRRYEAIVAPTNYKRPKAIFTKAMVEKAQEKIDELGFTDSLQRRFAVLSDISINNVLFANRSAAKEMKGDVFADLKRTTVDPKKFNKVQQIPIETFIADVLPTASSIELLVEGRHKGNLVSLIAPENIDSKVMFKWENNFSWAYRGNITDSMIELVKAAGGAVDGVLRFSLKWNEDGDNPNDFDAHCITPVGHLIYFGDRRDRGSQGSLDVDIINPRDKVAIENITFPDKRYMPKGVYSFKVHTFGYKGGDSGFTAEIAFGGDVFQFEHRKPTRSGEKIDVVEVNFDGDNFQIVKSMESTSISSTVWEITTGEFVPVSTFMLSPNYWDGHGVGNKHYFFMLQECVNDESPNGFFNEFLIEELNPHRKVLEALAGKMKVPQSNQQLSGLGFSSTKHDKVFCKVNGNVSRVVEILF